MQTHLRSLPLYRFCVLFVIVLLASSELVLSTNYPIFRDSNEQWITFPSILSQSEIHYYYIKFSNSRTHGEYEGKSIGFGPKDGHLKNRFAVCVCVEHCTQSVVCKQRVVRPISNFRKTFGITGNRNLFDSIEIARVLQVSFSLIHSCCERAILTEHTPKTHKRY